MKQPIDEIKRIQELAGISESSLVKEYGKGDVEKLKQLKELFAKVIEFNESLKALPVTTLEEMMKDLEDRIEDAPKMTYSVSHYDWQGK